jgi:hypothetical protein
LALEGMGACQHRPPCGTASVHHARVRMLLADARTTTQTIRPWAQPAPETTPTRMQAAAEPNRPSTPPQADTTRPLAPPTAEATGRWTQQAAEIHKARLRRKALDLAIGLAPWEMTAEEFAAAAEPWVELNPPRAFADGPMHRVFGISVSMLRHTLRLRMVVRGGPEAGYEVDVPWEDELSLEDPRRAFLIEALSQGLPVPRHVLADYPDLQRQGT